MTSAFSGKERAPRKARVGGSADGTRIRAKLYLRCCRACRRHQGCHCRKRRLRYVTDFWAALGQAAACLYLSGGVSGAKHNGGSAGHGGIFQLLTSLFGPSVPMSVCHRPRPKPMGPAGRTPIVLRLPQKGRVKCSRRSNIERKLPNSRDSSPIHRVRRAK